MLATGHRNMNDKITDSTESISSVGKVIGEFLKISAETEEAKEAAIQVGSAARTLAKSLNVALLPIAAINFAYDKARIYFETRFEADLAKVLERRNIDASDAYGDPRATVVEPIMRGLGLAHGEPGLRDMYLELLASELGENGSHPGFAHVLQEMTSEEARYLRSILAYPGAQVARLLGMLGTGHLYTHTSYVINEIDSEGGPLQNPRFPTMVANWIRLGLVEIEFQGERGMAHGRFLWLQDRPEYKNAEETELDVTVLYGNIMLTDFGEAFCRAIGISYFYERPRKEDS